jgi:hypothetical protein
MKYFNESKHLKHQWLEHAGFNSIVPSFLSYDVVPVIHKASGDLWYITDKNNLIGNLSDRFKNLLDKLSSGVNIEYIYHLKSFIRTPCCHNADRLICRDKKWALLNCKDTEVYNDLLISRIILEGNYIVV